MAETALAVLFPELEPLIGDLHRRLTPNVGLGLPPHLTLLVPFADTAEVDRLAPRLADVLGRFAPFEVSFPRLGRFPDVLYLNPDPAKPFEAMIAALVDAFPDYPPYDGAFEDIVPHVTVAVGERDVLDEVEASLELDPVVPLRVERVWLLANEAEVWRRLRAFALNRRIRV